MPVRLIPTSEGKPIKLDKPVLLIGRNPDCDVILTNSRKVSRQHCLLACVDNRIIIRDLESTNGIWVNGHRVDREAFLKVGDDVGIADLHYEVRRVDAEGRDDRRTVPIDDEQMDELKAAKARREHLDRVVAREVPPDQDIPIAIPDEEDSFVVEASSPRLPRVKPGVSALARLLESDPEIKLDRRTAARNEPASDDVIPSDQEVRHRSRKRDDDSEENAISL
jgi:hypothetical protein